MVDNSFRLEAAFVTVAHADTASLGPNGLRRPYALPTASQAVRQFT